MQLTWIEEEFIQILAEYFQKKNVIRKIFSQTEEHNLIYSRNVDLSMWIGLILLRLFESDWIQNIQFAE